MNNRTVNHIFLDEEYAANREKKFPDKTIAVTINRPGKLNVSVTALGTFKNISRNKPVTTASIPVDWQLIDPIGTRYTKSTISMADLNRYKDARGFIKPWNLKVKSDFVGIDNFVKGFQYVKISVFETIPSSSASPLVNFKTTTIPKKEFLFDLYQLGELRAFVKGGNGQTVSSAKISLIRPDGTIHKSQTGGKLACRIGLAELKYSREQGGKISKWKLIVDGATGRPEIFAQVYDTVKIPKEVLLERLAYILGNNGVNIELKCDWIGHIMKNQVTIKPKSNVLAENLEHYNVIREFNPASDYKEIETGKEYVLAEHPLGTKEEDLDDTFFDYNVKFHDFKLSTLRVNFEKSWAKTYTQYDLTGPDLYLNREFPYIHFKSPTLALQVITIPSGLPKLIVEIDTSGYFDLIINNYDNIEGVRIPKIIFEVVFSVGVNGRISCLTWIDFRTNSSANTMFNNLLRGFTLKYINAKLSGILEGMMDHMLGAVLDITDVKWNNEAMEVEYIADVLTQRKPNSNYNSAIQSQFGGGLNQSWISPLLTDNPEKIKHIVVLMMENRSFDHVLGYLSLITKTGTPPNLVVKPAPNPNVNGLTPEVVGAFSDTTNRVRHLKYAKFPANEAGLRTKLPLSVGHHYNDVMEQISNGTMKGFVDNFKKGRENGLEQTGTEPQDVLGYYTDEDLKMYKYLIDNFAICDNYFSSHPGPTLPNRMYALSGELHLDRNGEPKMENSVDTSFFLSREINVFDILEQHGVSWRVYESFPSVTMLRMFTRYAGNNEKIKNFETFQKDIMNAGMSGTKSEFPSVVFIDPAMHDVPINDDHPPADMLHGQYLIKKIFDDLKSNDEIWNHTLFVINYDEHGGFFDHVSPKTVEVFKKNIDSIGYPGDTHASNSGEIKVTYGVRVPCFVVSPYVEKGSVIKTTLDHTSILKTILIRFCGKDRPFLSDRINAANNIGGALTSELRNKIPESPKIGNGPDDIPELPDRRRNLSAKKVQQNFKPISRKSLSSRDADFHDFIAFLGRTVKPFK